MPADSLGFIHQYYSPAPGDGEAGNPTLLLLHGTGGDEGDLVPLGRTLLPGAGILSPRGKVLEGGAPRFFRRLAPGVLDQEDLTRRTRELVTFIDAAATTYGFDRNRVVAIGFSNGANIAASLLLRGMPLRGAVLLSPMLPFEPTTLPDLTGTDVFIGAGRTDPLVPAVQAEHLAEVLRTAGADVALHWEPGGHTLTSREVDAAKAWLAQMDQKAS
jgi:predicted esterase